MYLFDLGPDGYLFQKDIKMRVYLDNADLEGINPEDLKFIYYDEDDEEWKPEP